MHWQAYLGIERLEINRSMWYISGGSQIWGRSHDIVLTHLKLLIILASCESGEFQQLIQLLGSDPDLCTS